MADDRVTVDQPYKESDHHVPHPTHQTGTLDTSGTSGVADSNLREVTPIFDVAEKQDIEVAARALDPDDPTPSHMVVLPQGAQIQHSDPEAAKERVLAKAEKSAKDRKVRPKGRTPAQQEAAESGDDAAQKAKAEQESQGAGKRG